MPDGENIHPENRQTRLRMYDAEPLSLLSVRFLADDRASYGIVR